MYPLGRTGTVWMRAMVIIGTIAAGSAACAVMPAGGPGSPAPGSPGPQGPRTEVPALKMEFAGDELTLTDADTGTVIVSPSGWPVWRHAEDPKVTLRPKVAARGVKGGVDITYTYHNTSPAPMRLGQFAIGGIRLGSGVQRVRADLDGQPVPVAGDTSKPHSRTYPGQLYSPVAVLIGETYTVGVSLLTNPLEQRHRTAVSTFLPGGRFGDGWRVSFVPNAFGNHLDGADIQPGEERSYTVALRILKGVRGDAWLATLTPYREYFRGLWGDVDYTRDPRPVYATALAQNSNISADNPRGYNFHPSRNPELAGWGPWIAQLRSAQGLGFERFMVVAPSGVFAEHQGMNFPFQFTSPWKSRPKVAQSLPALREFARSVELGLWWGRSTTVMDGWDSGDAAPFDPDNAHHVARVLEELGGAVDAGATMIGLDDFGSTEPWNQARFLDIAAAKYPGVRFVIEPVTADFLHNRAAMYVWVTRPQSAQNFQVNGPHLLADFLNPGHETWGRVDAAAIRSMESHARGRDVPASSVDAWARRAASFGYTPVVHYDLRVGPEHRAKDTSRGGAVR